MAAAVGSCVKSELLLAGSTVTMLKGGSGRPVLILHHETGNPGWLPFYELLASRFVVTVPSMPGFDHSERPDWMGSVRDLAILLHLFLDRQTASDVTLIGLGFGGWVAAEMATMNQDRFLRMVLVGAPGVQPREGQIYDQFLVNHTEHLHTCFHDSANFDALYGGEPPLDQLEQWELNRETTARIAWKPYMFNRSLPTLLPEVRIPTLLVWGDHDQIVPLDCGHRYLEALPDARLEIVAGAGHFVEIEQPAELDRLVGEFLGG